jgi:hypothetical protein
MAGFDPYLELYIATQSGPRWQRAATSQAETPIAPATEYEGSGLLGSYNEGWNDTNGRMQR